MSTFADRPIEGEAWQQYALCGRGAGASIANGVTVFMQGRMWQMTGEGRALILRNGRTIVADEQREGASLVNLWL